MVPTLEGLQGPDYELVALDPDFPGTRALLRLKVCSKHTMWRYASLESDLFKHKVATR